MHGNFIPPYALLRTGKGKQYKYSVDVNSIHHVDVGDTPVIPEVRAASIFRNKVCEQIVLDKGGR
jgi:hypothetical protein